MQLRNEQARLGDIPGPDLPTALIVGGSIAGLSAANLLVRAGWDVTVAERTPGRLSGRGAGIVTHPPLVRVLERAGMPAGTSLGVAVPGRRAFARNGTIVAERPLPQVLTSWSRLHAVLEDAYAGHTVLRGCTASGLTQDTDGATVRFTDGTERCADLVVAADGIRSALRIVLAPQVQPQYAGYLAWRGLVEEPALTPATRVALCSHFGFFLSAGEQILGYPVAGADGQVTPGQRRYNFVWYRPTREAELAAMNVDAAGQPYPGGIPPACIRPDLLATMRQDALTRLAPPFAEAVVRTTQPFFQPIADLAMPRMAWGRVAFIGDAAFVARPHLGMGVTKAAEDAAALVDAVTRHPSVQTALAVWSAVRTTAGKALVTQARHLGDAMQSTAATEAHPDAIAAMLQDTAVGLPG